MRIKNKTELRKLIKNSIGNAYSLIRIEFYRDGSWMLYAHTEEPDLVFACQLGNLAYSDEQNNKSVNAAITYNFKQIEKRETEK